MVREMNEGTPPIVASKCIFAVFQRILSVYLILALLPTIVFSQNGELSAEFSNPVITSVEKYTNLTLTLQPTLSTVTLNLKIEGKASFENGVKSLSDNFETVTEVLKKDYRILLDDKSDQLEQLIVVKVKAEGFKKSSILGYEKYDKFSDSKDVTFTGVWVEGNWSRLGELEKENDRLRKEVSNLTISNEKLTTENINLREALNTLRKRWIVIGISIPIVLYILIKLMLCMLRRKT